MGREEECVQPPPSVRLPNIGDRALAVLAMVVVVVFGVGVVARSALLTRPMGDLSVYLMAAWTVQVDPDHLYDYTDHNGWHYSYPPLFAILMAPLAEAPRPVGADPTPFVIAVGVFYLFNVLGLFMAVHVLASALEQASPDPAVRGQPWGCQRWLRLRLLPILACLAPIGHTLMRGQTNLILLLLLCCAMAALIRGRRWLGGASLAGLACLKIFPAYLVLYPLWRRDWRAAGGWALGLGTGLLLIPALVLGPAQTIACYEKLAVVLIGPALNLSTDDSRAKELIEATATDSQSFLVVIHNTLHLDQDRQHRIPTAAPAVRLAHFALAALFTGLTLAAASRRRVEDGPGIALFLGALAVVMLISSPVCHTHYFALSLPLVMALLAREWDRSGEARLSLVFWAFLGAHMVGNALPLLPAFEILKDAGLALYITLGLWAAACVSLWRGDAATRAETPWRRRPEASFILQRSLGRRCDVSGSLPPGRGEWEVTVQAATGSLLHPNPAPHGESE